MFNTFLQIPAYVGQTILDLGGNAQDANLPNASGYSDGAAANVTSAFAAFGELLSRFMSIALYVAVILLLGYLLWGALDWLVSGGDSGKTQKARDKITQAMIGLIVLVSSVGIMLFVQNLLNICILDFSGNGCKSTTGGGNGGAVTCQSKGSTCIPDRLECSQGGGKEISGGCPTEFPVCCDF